MARQTSHQLVSTHVAKKLPGGEERPGGELPQVSRVPSRHAHRIEVGIYSRRRAGGYEAVGLLWQRQNPLRLARHQTSDRYVRDPRAEPQPCRIRLADEFRFQHLGGVVFEERGCDRLEQGEDIRLGSRQSGRPTSCGTVTDEQLEDGR